MKSECYDLGAEMGTKPVRVVICGEVSSGKSTVLNAFLRDNALPDNLGSAVRPVVYLRQGAASDVDVTYADGQKGKLDKAEDVQMLRGAQQISLLSDQPHLNGLELIEVPFTKAEELTPDQLDLVGSADVIVWVTISSQAWRLTEKSIVEALGSARPDHGILVLTRGDKIRNDNDRDKLLSRVKRETSDFFQHHMFVGGSGSQIEKAGKSDKIWQAIGGAKLAALLGGYVTEPAPAEAEVTEQGADGSNIVKMDRYKKPASEETPEQTAEAPVDTAADPAPAVAEEPTVSAEPVVEEPTVAEEPIVDEPAAVEETAVAAEPAPAEDVAPAAETDAPEQGGDLVSTLRSLVENIAHSACSGFVPNARKGECVVLSGDSDRAEAAAKACCASCDILVQAYAPDTGMFEACAIFSDENVLIFQDIADVGLLFIMGDKKSLNIGIAQRTMDRLAAACQAASA
ncbi:dynamin family protein [Actibacterium ureilyticum]|uniref:dynamin family protein n=1 Tax=Actibacterium ureilyticum TaxID=1590614 RepID=UPI000BAACBDC|nr:dynamin family protein [Actibacterium ureilyticum]